MLQLTLYSIYIYYTCIALYIMFWLLDYLYWTCIHIKEINKYIYIYIHIYILCYGSYSIHIVQAICYILYIDLAPHQAKSLDWPWSGHTSHTWPHTHKHRLNMALDIYVLKLIVIFSTYECHSCWLLCPWNTRFYHYWCLNKLQK